MRVRPNSPLMVTLAISLTLVGVPATMLAQTTMATLEGVVVDEQNAVLPGVTVTVRQQETNDVRTVVTSQGGRYFVPNLPAGSYEVVVELSGFTTQRRSGLILRVGQQTTFDIILTLGGLQQTIEVVGASTLLETTKTALGSLIREEEVDALPVLDRDFSSLAILAPGVTHGVGGYAAGGTGASLTMNGQRAFTNEVIVDGASDMWRFYGKQASTFSQDWIREFQVLTNSFAAEYGMASGGVLNVITRSGSNRLEGRAYAFFRDSKWDSPPFAGHYVDNEPIFLDDAAPFTQRRWGGFVGGPIMPDRLFFFAGYEDLEIRGTDQLGISDYWRARGEQTSIPTRTTDHPFMLKADANLNANHRLFVRFNRSVNINHNQGGALQTLGRRQTFGGAVPSVVGNLTSTLGTSMFNEARVSFLSNKPPILCNQAGAGGNVLLTLAPVGTFSQKIYPGATFGCGFTGLEGEQNLTFTDNLTWAHGRHQLKIGAQADRLTTFIDSVNVQNGRWNFSSDAVFDVNNPASYPFQWAGALTTQDYTKPAWIVGTFIQDNWAVRPDLTLLLGIRYDIDQSLTIANDFVEEKNAWIVDTLGGDQVFARQPIDWGMISPRLGFSWSPAGSRRTMVHGSFGLFYNTAHNNWAALYINQSLNTRGSFTLNANSALQNPFWDAANPAAGRAALRAFLAESFPAWPDVSALPLFGTQTLLDFMGLRNSYSRQFSLGLSHQFPTALRVDVAGVYTQGEDAPLVYDENVRLENGNYLLNDSRFGSIAKWSNEGWTRYVALQVQAQYNRDDVAISAAYTLSRTRSNFLTAITGGQATNPTNLAQDIGPDDSDRRHALTVHGSYLFPFDVQSAAIFTHRSALPWSVTTLVPLGSSPYRDRPEPRNSRRGDSETNLDLRLSKVVRFGSRMKATIFWEMFNALNTRNFTTYSGAIQSSSFGQAIAAAPMRRQQLGFRFDF